MQRAIAILCIVTLPGATTYALAQDPAGAPPLPPPGEQQQQQTPLLSPQELDNLVAPIALYPDPLLGQVLAAATYPLEIVEAQQWSQQNGGPSGQALIDAARQQNWDPSVQALVAFPDAMAMLTRDIRWTTDLGNAFLAQQTDVMAAIQRMRVRAQQNGRLQSNQQEVVSDQPGAGPNGDPAIQIQPADPQVIYVPQYNPVYVWGPPAWGAYPSMWYPPVSLGCFFGPAIFLGSLFAGFLGFGGWGWGLNWLANGLFLNLGFFNHFGFHGFGAGYYGRSGFAAWSHNPAHRMGVAYPNRALAGRYGAGAGRFAAASRSGYNYNSRNFNNSRSFAGSNRSYTGNRGGYAGNRGYAGSNNYRSFNGARNYSSGSYGRYGSGYSGRSYAPSSNYSARGYSGNSAARSYSAPRSNAYSGSRSYSAPRSNSFSGSRSYSAPRSNAYSGSRSYPAPRSNPFSSSRSFSAPRSSGGGRAPSQHFSAPKAGGGSSHASRSSGGGKHSSGGSHRK